MGCVTALTPVVRADCMLAPERRIAVHLIWTNLFPLFIYRGNKLGKRDKDEKKTSKSLDEKILQAFFIYVTHQIKKAFVRFYNRCSVVAGFSGIP